MFPGGYKAIAWRYNCATPDVLGKTLAESKKITKKGKKSSEKNETATQSATRFIFCKEHGGKKNDNTYPKKRTLFVLNPPLGSPDSLSELLTSVGEVRSVVMTTLGGRKGSTSDIGDSGDVIGDGSSVPAAFVVFAKAVALRAALELERVLELPRPNATEFGMQKWERAFDASRPDAAVLQQMVDEDLNAFDDKVAQERAQRLASHGMEDADGWTMVAKGGKTASEDNAATTKKRTKERQLQNFYRFQLKESRKEEIADLRRRFDQDKEKVKALRSKRKFKPY
eukprot:m.104433 g.104433  ORF g.104433 m.104433 type:complete len:283 (+) comp16847_c0_seq1:362-1210(+)